jgi:hypothetical protein
VDEWGDGEEEKKKEGRRMNKTRKWEKGGKGGKEEAGWGITIRTEISKNRWLLLGYGRCRGRKGRGRKGRATKEEEVFVGDTSNTHSHI